MANPKLAFDIVADVSKANKDLKKLEQAGTTTTASIAKGFAIAQIGIAAAGKAIGAVTGFINESIEAAKIQTQAFTTLNASLSAHGNYTKEASDNMVEFAAEMQSLTVIGDDVTMTIASTIEAITGLGADELPRATEAAIGLSKTFGIDLTAAAKLVGKELISTTSSLSRYGIKIDKTASQSEQLDEIVRVSAAGLKIMYAEAETAEGRMKQLDNSIGDAREAIGAMITDNQTLAFALGETTNVIVGLVTDIEKWIDSNDEVVTSITKDVLNALVLFAQGISAVVTGINEVVVAAKIGAVAIELIGAAASKDVPEVFRLMGEIDQLERALFDTIMTGTATNESLNNLRASIAEFTPAVRDGAAPAANDLATGLTNVEVAAEGAASGVDAAARAVEGFNYQFSIFGDQAAAIESGGTITGMIPGGAIISDEAGAIAAGGGGTAGGGFTPATAAGGATFAAAGVRPRGGLPLGGFSSQILSGFAGTPLFESATAGRMQFVSAAGGGSLKDPKLTSAASAWDEIFKNRVDVFSGRLERGDITQGQYDRWLQAETESLGTKTGQGTSESNPIYVRPVGGSFGLAEAVV